MKRPISTRFVLLSVLAAGLGLTAVGAETGCSFGLNTTDVQCLSEAECLAKGFANTTCDPQTKTCVPVNNSAGLCQHNTDCINANGGQPAICLGSGGGTQQTGKCVSLLTAECPFYVGKPTEIQNDHVVVLGALTPANDTQLGAMMEASVALAQSDFSQAASGLPPIAGTTDTRPVVFLSCNEFGNGSDGLIRAGNHLVHDVQVPIVVGPVDPGNAAVIGANVTLPNKVLNILPTAIFSGLSNLPNPIAPTPLLWRVNVSDSNLVGCADSFLNDYLADYTVTLGIRQSTDPLKVMVIEEGNISGVATGTQLTNTINFNAGAPFNLGSAAANENTTACNNGPCYSLANLGNQRDPINNPTPNQTAALAVAAALQFQPQIIFYGSSLIAVNAAYTKIEANWPSGVPHPIHVAVNPSWDNALLYQAIGANTALRQRTFILRSKALPPSALSSAWNVNFYASPDGKQFTGVPINPLLYNLYDSALIGIFAAASVGSEPLTGPNSAARLQAGAIDLGTVVQGGDTSGIPSAIQSLFTGSTIKYSGLSGPLDWDLNIGAVNSDAEVACIEPGTNGLHAVPSGYVWDHKTKQGSGASSVPTNCP